jgi:hypothetical protein
LSILTSFVGKVALAPFLEGLTEVDVSLLATVLSLI